MEIRNLLTFATVAEMNSFTRAAQMLGYAQSTVSFQIRQLEQELDCLLFERINHTLTLTQRGRELLTYAQQVCRLTEEFRQSLKGADAVVGEVHILTADSVCEAMLVEHYADFHRRYPGVKLRFSSAGTDDMFRILDRNEADLMLTLDSHAYQRDYVIAKETQIETHFVAGARSPLAGRPLTISDLTQEQLILTERGLGYRRVLDDMLARRSIALQPVLEVGRTDIITRLLEAGEHVSFLPDFVTRRQVEAGTLVYLDVQDARVEVWQQLIHHRSKWISRALRTFIDYVSEHEFGR